MRFNKRRLHEPINADYTLAEELLHSLSHGVGAVLSLIALVTLVILAVTRGSVWHIIGYTVFGTTLLALFLASTLFHGVQHDRLRPILRKVDHACIYLLIAGTYTPFVLISLRTTLGLTLLAVVWSMAVFGIVYKIFFIDRFVVLTTLAYVFMGWMSIIAWREMVIYLPNLGLWFLFIGGAFYSIGVIFYALTKIRYTHAVWHFFILAAGVCHFIAVLTLLDTA